MKTFNTILALVAGTVVALPTTEKNATFPAKMGSRGHGVCRDFLYSVPSCCSTDVLGILDLDCSTPSTTWDLHGTCASIGKSAHCCTLDLSNGLGLGVLCNGFISE
ncbi:hypothetical protein E4U13_004325 [Claviceps humidiphila]|uniref:Hydrophobin n=2 Tax=Claviceps TaxID=5110 RepID=A0A9P7PYD9_9HYPO|nr:hypothetical protein E4U56_005144 [Claviceps arundinis]KAG6060332.1 hypothetical protein E4U32_003511 [Claviceps aff. humidiphila group G2b]KAG6112301.1 hypothetical protein E4U13_004325 [Claviceps humidiphila]